MIYQLLLALLSGSVISTLGVFVIQRRQSLVGDAYSHIALPGAALFLLFNFNPLLGALLALILAAFLINFLQFRTRLHTEVLVGILFSTSLALGLLLIPEAELESILFGDLNRIGKTDFIFGLGAIIVLISLLRRFFKDLVFLTFSETLSEAAGLNLVKLNLVFLLMIGLSVVLGLRVAGTLLVGSLLIIPPATSQLISRSLKSLIGFSAIFGALSAVIGVVLADKFGFLPGAVVIICETTLFLLALVVSKIVNKL